MDELKKPEQIAETYMNN